MLSNETIPKIGNRFLLESLIQPGSIDLSQFSLYGRKSLLDKEIPITSIGSCFAREISIFLRKFGYNYLVTESNACRHASCGWNRVYNSACLKQIFQYTFSEFKPIERWWYEKKTKMAIDPFRDESVYPWEEKDKRFTSHIKSSNLALTKAKIVILTLGLIETWKDSRDGVTFTELPPTTYFNSLKHEFYLQTVDDVMNDLVFCHSLLMQHNPSAHIIISVSPVPLHCTFRKNINTYVANGLSKSTLRIAAEYFSYSYPNVTYFESFDIITQAIKNPFLSDNRHVRPEVVSTMMDIFLSKYRKD